MPYKTLTSAVFVLAIFIGSAYGWIDIQPTQDLGQATWDRTDDTLLYAGDPRAAIEALGYLAANAHSPADSIAVEMDVAWAELIGRGGPGNDALFDYNARINDLSRLYEEAVERHTASKTLLPTQLTLGAAWPNPFNGMTKIQFAIPEAGKGTLLIIDVQGRVVQTLLAGDFIAGRHSVDWNASESSAGTYFCKLSVAGESVTTKLILAK